MERGSIRLTAFAIVTTSTSQHSHWQLTPIETFDCHKLANSSHINIWLSLNKWWPWYVNPVFSKKIVNSSPCFSINWANFMMSPCKTCDVSHVYWGLGYTPRVKGLCMYVLHSIHSTEEQVLRSLVPPTPQILKTGSVDSWLPSFAHGHPIQTYHPSVLGNAQGSRVQVRSKCPMHYSRQANGGLGLASLISW